MGEFIKWLLPGIVFLATDFWRVKSWLISILFCVALSLSGGYSLIEPLGHVIPEPLLK